MAIVAPGVLQESSAQLSLCKAKDRGCVGSRQPVWFPNREDSCNHTGISALCNQTEAGRRFGASNTLSSEWRETPEALRNNLERGWLAKPLSRLSGVEPEAEVTAVQAVVFATDLAR